MGSSCWGHHCTYKGWSYGAKKTSDVAAMACSALCGLLGPGLGEGRDPHGDTGPFLPDLMNFSLPAV